MQLESKRFLIQTPLGAQLGTGTQPHYKTPGDFQIIEAVPLRMTKSLPRDGQITVKKTLNFFLNIFKSYCTSAFKVRKCNLRNSCANNFFLLPNQVVKMGKVIASDGSYVTLYDFLSAGFFVG